MNTADKRWLYIDETITELQLMGSRHGKEMTEFRDKLTRLKHLH
jgi:hypothetical protein